jgi:hypothetical protein
MTAGERESTLQKKAMKSARAASARYFSSAVCSRGSAENSTASRIADGSRGETIARSVKRIRI